MDVQTKSYIRSMLIQIRKMVPAEERPLLAYLIEMAAIEAGDGLHSSGGKRIRPSSGKGR